MAAHLKSRLPSATHLSLGFQSNGRTSHGTASTMVENLDAGGAVRRGGKITPVPSAYLSRTIDFGRGPAGAVTIPWGDVSTAFYSTGIGDIEVFIALPMSARLGLWATRFLRPILASGFVKKQLQTRIDTAPRGPTPAQRERSRSFLWGEVTDTAGQKRVSRLQTPDGYTLTAMAGVAIAQAALAGKLPHGFQTPAMALGADFVLSLPGVTRADEP